MTCCKQLRQTLHVVGIALGDWYYHSLIRDDPPSYHGYLMNRKPEAGSAHPRARSRATRRTLATPTKPTTLQPGNWTCFDTPQITRGPCFFILNSTQLTKMDVLAAQPRARSRRSFLDVYHEGAARPARRCEHAEGVVSGSESSGQGGCHQAGGDGARAKRGGSVCACICPGIRRVAWLIGPWLDSRESRYQAFTWVGIASAVRDFLGFRV